MELSVDKVIHIILISVDKVICINCFNELCDNLVFRWARRCCPHDIDDTANLTLIVEIHVHIFLEHMCTVFQSRVKSLFESTR